MNNTSEQGFTASPTPQRIAQTPGCPDRLSSIRGDRGYQSNGKLKLFRIFLDNEEQFDCEVADVTLGYIKRISVVKNPLTRQVRKTRSARIYGLVQIQLK